MNSVRDGKGCWGFTGTEAKDLDYNVGSVFSSIATSRSYFMYLEQLGGHSEMYLSSNLETVRLPEFLLLTRCHLKYCMFERKLISCFLSGIYSFSNIFIFPNQVSLMP